MFFQTARPLWPRSPRHVPNLSKGWAGLAQMVSFIIKYHSTTIKGFLFTTLYEAGYPEYICTQYKNRCHDPPLTTVRNMDNVIPD